MCFLSIKQRIIVSEADTYPFDLVQKITILTMKHLLGCIQITQLKLEIATNFCFEW